MAAFSPQLVAAKAVALPRALPNCDDTLKDAFRPDAQTTVLLVKPFKKGDSLVVAEAPSMLTGKAASDLCLVKLLIGPGNPGPADAPSTSRGIGIEIWLPTREAWDGRIHTIGGHGGYDGGQQGSPDLVDWPYAAATAGTEGSVSASTDSGHVATDGSWTFNPAGTPNRALWADFAHRAMHEMAVKTKALTLLYYGRPAHHAYYEGASTGGRHGYRLAQLYPDDYDGIIANLPTIYFTRWGTANFYRNLVVERDLGGVELTEGQQDLVSNAAIAACDVVGGEHLGYIMDNAACRYDPTKDRAVLCASDDGTNRTADCVTGRQAAVFNKFWYGITRDGSVPSPAIDNGVGTAIAGQRKWYGMMRGTSLYLAYFTKLNAQMMKLLSGGKQPGAASGGAARSGQGSDMVAIDQGDPKIAGPTFRNAAGGGQDLWKGLSYAQLAQAFDRGIAQDAVFGGVASDDPDLSRFKAHGGKFLSWHGWNDESIPVQQSMNYYDRVVRKMGGLGRVQDFYKLYLVPGGGHTSPHGTSNLNANPPAVEGRQFYKLMVDWVEKGVAPDRVEIASPKTTLPVIHQPICPYPQRATYTNGDPKVSSSFVCK